VLFHGEPGGIELVADPTVPDPETDWFVQEYGGGVMILDLSLKPRRIWNSLPGGAEV
jgi:hypothetical protein